MLWKPATPVYPKLIQEAPEGLTKEEAEELRRQGQNLLPICRLARNGIFLSLVKDVRDAFELSYLVKVNCRGLEPSDYKKIGAKLKDLVPCVLLSFDDEQILMWRGKDWKSRYQTPFSLVPKISTKDTGSSSYSGEIDDGDGESTADEVALIPKMMSLWKRALESNRALLLDETELSPDSLLERVEEFGCLSQAAEHSYPALIISGGVANDMDGTKNTADEAGENDEGDHDLCEERESPVPFGALPVDFIAERLHRGLS